MMLACGSTPPESEPPLHEKLLKLLASEVPFPAVPTAVAVSVTTLPTDVAVTPTLVLLRLMAAARFVAMVDVVPPSAKLAPVFTGSTPPLSVAPDTEILAPLLLVRRVPLPA